MENERERQKKENRKTGRNHIKRKTAKLEEKGRQEGTHLSRAKRLSWIGGPKKSRRNTNPTKQN